MIRRALGWFAFGGALLVVACSSEDEAKQKYPTVESYCAAIAAEECKAVAATCSVTDERCTLAREGACSAAAQTAASEERTYRPENAEACIDKTREIYQDRVIDRAKEEALRAACALVFRGTKARSEACTHQYDCEAPLVCDTDKGFCAEKVERHDKDPCNNPGDICAKGLYCKGEGTKFCTPKGKLDESCNLTDVPCLEDLRCNGSRCVGLITPGEPCDTDAECTTGYCNPDRRCQARQLASETGTCRDFGGS